VLLIYTYTRIFTDFGSNREAAKLDSVRITDSTAATLDPMEVLTESSVAAKLSVIQCCFTE